MARKHGPEQRARVRLRVHFGKRPAIAEFSKEGVGGAALTRVRWPTIPRWVVPRYELCGRCVVLQSTVHALLTTGPCCTRMRCRVFVQQRLCRARIQQGLRSVVTVALVALLPSPLVAARAAPRLEDVRRSRLLDTHLLLEQRRGVLHEVVAVHAHLPNTQAAVGFRGRRGRGRGVARLRGVP
eukprot:scaffold11136_cov66-Phaeocystis_antarctica.AAC.4